MIPLQKLDDNLEKRFPEELRKFRAFYFAVIEDATTQKEN